METNILIAVIAVSGTLAGAIVSAISTYFIQKVRYKRETDWEREKDKTQFRRELVSKRLSVIEEAATLMMFLTGIRMDREYGEGTYCDDATFRQKDQRVEEIYYEAHTFSKAINSKEVDDAFRGMSSKYWEIHTENITPEDYNFILSNYRKVIEAIDNLKLNA